jgi:hypothetical protein
MRTQMLGRKALWLGAMALLGGAGAARAQYPSGDAANGYPSGTSATYQATYPTSYGHPGQGQAGYSPAYSYYPGYGYYPNYGYYYPYNYSGYGNQGYPGYQAANAFQPQGDYPSGTSSALPSQPLSPDEIPGDDGPAKKIAAAGAPDHRERFWLGLGYESSWVKQWKLPTPLVTTGSPSAPAGVDPTTYHAAALGQPTTTPLYGDRVEFGQFDGIRASAGVYLDDCGRFAIEGIGFVQFPNSQHFFTASDPAGDQVIARPFTDVLHGVDTALPASFPAGFAPLSSAGSVSVDSRSQLLGAELNATYDCKSEGHFHWDALAGFRFLRLAESLTIRDNVTALQNGFTFNGLPLATGDSFQDEDAFYAANHFYGMQLGTGARWEGKYVFASVFGKVALGVTDEEVDINGRTTVNSALLGVQSAGAGVYAQPGNIGHHTRTELGYVPEGGLTFGVKILPCLRLTAGYSFLYWNAVVRPGGQIDRGLNPQTIPTDQFFGTPGGPARPQFHFNDESYWVQTVNVGLDLRF